jgi:hypothetical protein
MAGEDSWNRDPGPIPVGACSGLRSSMPERGMGIAEATDRQSGNAIAKVPVDA